MYDAPGQVSDLLSDYKKRVMRDRIVSKGMRIDGRNFEEVRPITCEVGILPRAHGSALFTRGETQALVIGTLGSERDEQQLEGSGRRSLPPLYAPLQFPAVLRG